MQKLDLWLRSVWALWDTHGTRLLGIFGTWFALLSALAVAVLETDSRIAAGLLVVSGFLGEATRARGQNNANASPPGDAKPPVVPPVVLVLAMLGFLMLAAPTMAAAPSPATWVLAGTEHPEPSSVIRTYKSTTWAYGRGNTWATKVRAAGTYACSNAVWGSDPAPGGGKECRLEDGSALIPTLPAGVKLIALAGELMRFPQETDAVMCSRTFTECSRGTRFPAMPNNIDPATGLPIADSGGGYNCVAAVFNEVKAGREACFEIPFYIPPAERRCYPPTKDMVISLLPPMSLTSTFYRYIAVPETFNADRNKLLVWLDTCSKKTDFEFFKWADLGPLAIAAANGDLKDSESIKAWRRTQPIEDDIPAAAWDWAVSYALLQDASPPPSPPSAKVKPSSATDPTRQVYKANAAGTGIGSSLAGIKVMQGKPCGARFVGDYFSVDGQLATNGTTIPPGSFAVCLVN